jgi:hypothetical protein
METLQLPIPDHCPQVLREIMERCWKLDPEERPVSFFKHNFSLFDKINEIKTLLT